ncbi:WD40 repeat domain-containing protein [Chloropicon primus]|uniref:WD40 repeat domain-containing protein n=2 Tax=Chloropicon primus TaxID=1764295 RepID=A0A5B8MIE6_9CHLO|nr:WD40 repeat domain-containing protein [Chloropicon primus]UPQ98644.1 WD40 repeat domain-containing protein [Chloropicon primus]|eukprot:QDZ19435.1 WD40 repeat domain-containing protein [Chloropicon primus]
MNFGFNNLLGSPYRGGNACFDGDGNDTSLYVGVGNRVAKTNLATTVTTVLKFEAESDIERIALRPDGRVLAVVDKLARLSLLNTSQNVVLHKLTLKGECRCMEYSPCGRYLAVGVGKVLQVWDCSVDMKKTFAPLRLHVQHGSAHDDLTTISWNSEGTYLACGSRDLGVHVFSRDKVKGFKGAVLTGHRDNPVLAQFTSTKVGAAGSEGSRQVLYTLSQDGKLMRWAFKPDGGGEGDEEDLSRGSWILAGKHFVERQGAKITSCHLHPVSQTLVVGFKDGRFELFQMPDFTSIQSLSVSRDALSTAVINPASDLVAIGCAKLGQLLVWNWQSESYVFKQQGHFYDVLSLDFSKDGSQVVTGSADGKVKVWNVRTGLCFVTFTDHKMPVTAVRFIPSNHAVASASMDGTVKAFDLIRYRNFRTFKATEPAQFSCLAIDPSGEIIAAGSKDTFQVHLWSMKTGHLLDVLSGHEGPVSGITFDGNGTTLATSSWDKTVQLWDTFTGKGRKETLSHYHDVLCLAYRPDNKQMCAGTLDGQLSFWETTNFSIEGTIDARLDLRTSGAGTAAGAGMCFSSIAYSAAGEQLFGAGRCNFVCVYDTTEMVLLSRIQISHNVSLDGVLDKLNSKRDGVMPMEDPAEEDKDLQEGRGEVRASCIGLSPAGDSWAVAATPGVLVFCKDESLMFQPDLLDEDITPAAVARSIRKREWGKALVMSLRMKDKGLLQEVLDRVPVSEIDSVVTKVPPALVHGTVEGLMEKTVHLERLVMWVEGITTHHGRYLRRGAGGMVTLRALHKALNHYDLTSMVEDNLSKLDYIEQVRNIT